jgi:hypothetical protein
MKLTHESFSRSYPMLPGRHEVPGSNDMPNLRLLREMDDTDVIPFPSQGTGWQPRPLFERPAKPGKHDAEAALEQVELHLNRLAGLLGNGDDDRPSAA